MGELNSAQSSHIHQVLLAWTMMALIWCHTGSRLVAVWMIQGPGRSNFYRPLMRSAVYSALE